MDLTNHYFPKRLWISVAGTIDGARIIHVICQMFRL
jgi:hypothetical protein